MKRTLWKQENYKEYPVMVNQEQKQPFLQVISGQFHEELEQERLEAAIRRSERTVPREASTLSRLPVAGRK